MLLKQRDTGHLAEVADLTQLVNPFEPAATVQVDYGEEISDPEAIPKAELCFPSGEGLPQCWTDPYYREPARRSRGAAHA